MKPEMVRKGAVSRKPRVGRSPTDREIAPPSPDPAGVCIIRSGTCPRAAAAAAAASSGLRTDYKVTSCHTD